MARRVLLVVGLGAGLCAARADGSGMRAGLRAGVAQASAAYGSFKSEALNAALAECGEFLGDEALKLQRGDGSGFCPDFAPCDNFYTLGNLLEAIETYNRNRALEEQFPESVLGSRCLTLAAFLAQTSYESDWYAACKEMVMPCLNDKCSGGWPQDYSPTEQKRKNPDWKPLEIPGSGGRTGPLKGCKDYWGRKINVTENCWFGRGAMQISWLPNYVRYLSPELLEDPDQMCLLGTVGWGTAVAFWQSKSYVFNGTSVSATMIPSPAQCDQKCFRDREKRQFDNMEALHVRTAPPTPPPRGELVLTKELAMTGCWGIGNKVCRNEGCRWSETLCEVCRADGRGCEPVNRGQGGCSPLYADDVVKFNCAGC
jgi:hypothetical protein